MHLDDIHSGHGEPGPVDHAADVSVQGDVVEVVVGGLHLPGVFLAPVPLVEDALLPEVGVVVELQLGVEADKVTGAVLREGVDLDHTGVLEAAVGAGGEDGRLPCPGRACTG